VTARTPARDKSASREADKALEEQRLKNAKDLEEARALADSKLKKTLEEEEKKRVEKIAGKELKSLLNRFLVDKRKSELGYRRLVLVGVMRRWRSSPGEEPEVKQPAVKSTDFQRFQIMLFDERWATRGSAACRDVACSLY